MFNKQAPVVNGNAAVQKTWFGRSRFGGGTRALVAGTIGLGGVVDAVLSYSLMHFTHQAGWQWFGLYMLAFALTSGFLGWVLLVDRSTLKTVSRNQVNCVEHSWKEKAGWHAFLINWLVLSLGGVIIRMAHLDLDLNTVISAFAAFYIWSYLLCYLVQRMRG